MAVEAVKNGPKHSCPKHPDQEQVVCRKPGKSFGRLLGRCLICMQEGAVKSAKVRGENKTKGITKSKAKPAKLEETGKVLVLNFAACADEDLWADLHEEAQDEFRTPEMQALHLIRVMLRGQEAGV